MENELSLFDPKKTSYQDWKLQFENQTQLIYV